MSTTKKKILWSICIGLMILYSVSACAFGSDSEILDCGPLIETLNIKQLNMRQLARLLSQGTGWKIIVSQGAAEVETNIYLENVHTEDALKAICQVYNLWYKKDPESHIISIITLGEYQKGLRIYSKEAVEVVTLRYSDAKSVGDVLQRLFGDRLIWKRSDREEEELEDEGLLEDVENALERMDALADRMQFDSEASSSGSSSYNSRSSSSNSSSYRNRNNTNSRNPYYSSSRLNSQEDEITEDIQRQLDEQQLMEVLTSAPVPPTADTVNLPDVVYVSVFRGTNELLLRSGDPDALRNIVDVIHKLDKPKAQVLLEVKVLDVALNDEDSYGIDWLFEAGDFSGGRSTGINSSTLGSSYGTISSPSSSLVPQGIGLDSRAMVLQVVSDNVLSRIQLMKERNRIVSLATPTLCVADNEASRIFVGTETTILTSVEVEQVTTSGNNPVTNISVDPETERQNIGTTLLITPRIHSDRTATIRIVQEDSSLGDLQTINYGSTESFQSQDVDTRSVVTTVVASDGQICAIGGLIRKEKSHQEIGIPGLMDVPIIGSLFKTDSRNNQRHELLILIRPYILLAPGEAESASKTLANRLSNHPDARNDTPANTGDTNVDLLFEKEKSSSVSTDAFEEIKDNAAIWMTE